MKKFKNFAIKKNKSKDMYLLVPHPFTLDLYDIIKEFNKYNEEINKGFVLIDLETIIGNRKGKFVLLNIIDFKLIRGTIKEFCGSIEELREFKVEYYSTFDDKIKKHLFPLKLRDELLKVNM